MTQEQPTQSILEQLVRRAVDRLYPPDGSRSTLAARDIIAAAATILAVIGATALGLQATNFPF